MPYEIRTVAVEPGSTLLYDPEDWRDALVLVKQGVLVLEAADGCAWRFRSGHMLWLQDLPLRALRNPGDERVVLVSAARSVAS